MIWQEFFEKLLVGQENGDLSSVVKSFLASKVPESAVLDYKWRVDLTTKEHKEKLARWIAGLANTNGGLLFLGVKELDKTGEPDPDSDLEPVLVPSGTDISQHVSNIVNSYINPRPQHYLFPVPVQGGQAAVIIVPASANKPHVVQSGGEFVVPIRRGTSIVTASRAELDLLYMDRQLMKRAIEETALEQYDRYCPTELVGKPTCFIYATPVGSIANISLKALRESDAYGKRERGIPGWGGSHRLPEPLQWKGCAEAGLYDYPGRKDEEPEYRAVAYQNGAIASWSCLLPEFWAEGERVSFINPYIYFASLHGTLAPWLSFLTNLGIIASVEGLVLLQNVAGCYPRLRESLLFVASNKHVFEADPPLFRFSTQTPLGSKAIADLCFDLFAKMFYACGHTADLGDRTNPNSLASELEREILHIRS